jgi:TrmH family RNA methyltransferase
MAQLCVAGLRIIAASAKQSGSAGKPPPDLRGACAIFIGNEGAGLPPEVERSADGLFAIPMASGVDSLNAGVAASVFLYEAAQQRSENGAENRIGRSTDRITGKG